MSATARRPLRALALPCLCAALLLALGSSTASARQVVTHSFASSFNGAGSTAGPFDKRVNSVAVDEATGSVYVADGTTIDKFGPTGSPASFSAPQLFGSTSLTVTKNDGEGLTRFELAVDNSESATQGRIYAVGGPVGERKIYAFEPGGEPVGGAFPIGPSQISPPALSPSDIAVDPTSGDFWVDGEVGEHRAAEFTPQGTQTGKALDPDFFGISSVSLDTGANVYLLGVVVPFKPLRIVKYGPGGDLQYRLEEATDLDVDPQTDDLYVLSSDGRTDFSQYDSSGERIATFGDGLSGLEPLTVAVNGTSGRIYAVTGTAAAVRIYDPGATVTVPDVATGSPTAVEPTAVTLNGTVDPDGVATTGCQFEWEASDSEGTNEFTFAHSTSCEEGSVLSGSGTRPVRATIPGLTQGAIYHYRLSVSNSEGQGVGVIQHFTPSAIPSISKEFVSDVHADSVRFHARLNPGGGATEYTVEYGPADCESNPCSSTLPLSAGAGLSSTEVSTVISGLSPGTPYHYRVLATNPAGTLAAPDRTFTTFPQSALLEDHCPNAHVRQQTGSALLLDCRAYELVSAPDTGGYDVESDLVAGQLPFDSYPAADGRALYAIHSGAIPGSGVPTNLGRDAYLATRTASGWATLYVGIPADNQFASGPFASALLEASPALSAFAFGGEDICSPCFADGSTNVPLRLPDGELVQGMVGSEDPGPAEPAGYIGRRFSADGQHFLFGTKTKLEPQANSGETTIYERDLSAGTTQVVSTLEDGSTMTGEVGSLDASDDGERVLVGRRTAVDAAGNSYWHLFMHRGTDSHSVDLMPGASQGALFAGMTGDGSRVFFTTAEPLLAADEDTSPDLYEAQIGATGPATLRLLSADGPAPQAGNVDTCDPVAGPDGNNWNAVGAASPNTCGVVAIAGGAGVARGDGTIYFLSPEPLDGQGVANEPNLFVVQPGGSPSFVATLEATNPLVRDAVKDNEVHRYGDFQMTPDGRFAAFATTRSLTGYENDGYFEVFRDDPAGGGLVCASCNPTNAIAQGDASLAAHGLSLADDGRVFFNTTDALAPRDLDGKEDAYEFEDGDVQLISTGASPFDSSLLGVSDDGVDVFFFTRDSLVPEDENGSLAKLYDARAEGGFPFVPPSIPCKASDECHGPGSASPSPPGIRTLEGEGGNQTTAKPAKPACNRPRVRRHGRCLKPRHHRKIRNHHKRGKRA